MTLYENVPAPFDLDPFDLPLTFFLTFFYPFSVDKDETAEGRLISYRRCSCTYSFNA